VINGTNASDVINVVNNNGVVTVTGLAETVTISNFEATDKLVINGLGGDDAIVASGMSGMLLTADGGDGNDILIGSPGNDSLLGGAGDDVLVGNGGQDVLDAGPGSNVVFNAATPAPTALLSQFMASSFASAGTGEGGTTPVDPSAAQQQLTLAQPHA
jgi:Ca2+-binding RTX toxin-like protein